MCIYIQLVPLSIYIDVHQQLSSMNTYEGEKNLECVRIGWFHFLIKECKKEKKDVYFNKNVSVKVAYLKR